MGRWRRRQKGEEWEGGERREEGGGRKEQETHLSTTAECVLADGERPPVVFGAGLDTLTALATSTSSR